MQVSVETLSPLERRLTITLPPERLEQQYEKTIADLAKNTKKLNGFRPGKASPTHIKRIYGVKARQEALGDLIQSSLGEALTSEKLNPVSMPMVDEVDPNSINAGSPLIYKVTFEVLPEIADIKFSTDTIEKQVATLTDGDIDKVIDRLLEQHTTWTEVDRPAQDKDQVLVDFRGTIDGEAFSGGDAHDYPLVIGSKTMIPGFEEGVLGIKKGEKKTITVKFPDNYFSEKVAGKEAQFEMTAHKVSAPQLPEIDEALVKKFGIKSGKIEELRAEIKKNLDREIERIIATKLKNTVFDLLVDQNPLEVPKALIEQEAKRIHDEVHPNHAGKEHSHTPEENAQFDAAAKRNVTLGLLVGEVVKKHDIKPDATKVQDHITQLAGAYEKPAEVIQWYASDKKRLAEVEMLIMEGQVIDKLLENVQVVEKQQTYAELVSK